MYLSDLILQIPGLAPAYTKHPIFPDLFSAMIVAALISIGLNFAFALLRKKTTDIDRLSKVMKETNEWRKEYTDAIRKQDKVRISELKKKQAYVNKMSLEMQQQQMRPMMLYMIPSFMLWILVFPSIFGQTVALSPLHIPYLMCTDENVKKDTVLDENGQPKGVCNIPGEVFLWGWFLITSLGTSGIIAKITKTSLPSMT
ncbi:MAG: EMC3/TMCO1 family protein [Nitrososphaeraceae archaeon]|jgi:uncharacterized membrane protein (DUF106 family)|nr:EMC3/TMCO1 family protein [Nitrososphaeraceae archaeon]